MDYIENRTFAEIQVGDSASLSRTLTPQDIKLFAVISGDVNPAHLDEEYAKSDIFKRIIAHGMWTGSLLSTLLGTKLPGPGTIYLGQTLRFRRPVGLGDVITVSVTAKEKEEGKRRITFACECVNQAGEVVIDGSAEVIAPTEKVKRPRVTLPEVLLHDKGANYRQMLELTKGKEPIKMGVVHPVDRQLLSWALEAAQARFIIPTFIGPGHKIRALAEEAGIDITPYQLISTEHSHAAVEQALTLARAGAVEALMVGNSHIQELLRETVDKEKGLLTGRRISHTFIMDVPTYPRPLFITDAGINVAPTLAQKRDIVQNAIELAQAFAIKSPKVAILSASETVNPKIQSSLDAAALCKMVDRGQITGGLVDGPLTFDSAISAEAATAKGTVSQVAGNADILLVPDLEAGTMLAEQLEHLADAQSIGIVLGAKVPIAVLQPTDSPLLALAACAVALLLVRSKQHAKL